MKKKIMIGAVVPLVASLGLWLAVGSASAHATHTAPASRSEVSTGADTDNIQSGDQTTPDVQNAKASNASRSSDPTEDPSGTDGDTVQSGDQTSPDTGATVGTENGSPGEGTTTETDGVDCQQDGNFDGVNPAGTGPGCDGSGT